MAINYRPLLDFMKKRHDIFLKRRQYPDQPHKWTKDEILRTYKFTNVFRELDRGTVWVKKHIRQPYRNHPDLWFMLAIARQTNHPPTIQELIDNASTGAWPDSQKKGWDWKEAMRVLRTRAKRGEQVYTGAYLLNANGQTHPKIRHLSVFDKPLFTCALVLDLLWQDRHDIVLRLNQCTKLEEMHAIFLPYHGWGGFTAYEVVSDYRHTRYFLDAPPQDVNTWAHAGPGCKRGLLRLGGTKGKPLPRLNTKLALDQMRELYAQIDFRWVKYFGNPWRIEMREIEHSLCEFDKYERARTGQGRPRAKFTLDLTKEPLWK